MENEGEFGHSQMGVPRGTWESFNGEGRVDQVFIESRPTVSMSKEPSALGDDSHGLWLMTI